MKTTIQKTCAVYTRKSTEEGLEQDFNTLHAQREACEAYVLSQQAEGWVTSKASYDDGGFSGGSLARPALEKLIEDIKAGLIDIVVVYKIDRLTRSLMDFAKLVDIFDEHNVTFVSVTQSFNTTTSMGRLTLNVLLSFAQFEREVTSERIRDKITASKKKGMWMGGYPPMGYKIAGRTLEIVPEEARIIKQVFETYLEASNVGCLKRKLDERGIVTRVHISAKGTRSGGKPFSRGKLYHTLNNQAYIGKISHKGEVYEGQHQSIIDDELFEKVQRKLAKGGAGKTTSKRKSGSLLRGLIYDTDDNIYTPTYTSKSGKRYCYYINQKLLKEKGNMARIPAFEIEKAVTDATEKWVGDNIILTKQILIDGGFVRSVLNKVVVAVNTITLHIDTKMLCAQISTVSEMPSTTEIIVKVKFKMRAIGNGSIVINTKERNRYDPLDLPPETLKRIVRGTIWREAYFAGQSLHDIAREGSHGRNYVRRCIVESLNFPSG